MMLQRNPADNDMRNPKPIQLPRDLSKRSPDDAFMLGLPVRFHECFLKLSGHC